MPTDNHDDLAASPPEPPGQTAAAPPRPARPALVLAAILAGVCLLAVLWTRDRGARLPDFEEFLSNDASRTSQEIDEPAAGSTPRVVKSEAEWRAQLTPQQYAVTRLSATERAFTGKYWDHKEAGEYHCVCCGVLLFKSDTKFDSPCGWPSFSDVKLPANITTRMDLSLGVPRVEVLCRNCGAHLGHLFDDGPLPGGQRYCINSAALDFAAADQQRTATEETSPAETAAAK